MTASKQNERLCMHTGRGVALWPSNKSVTSIPTWDPYQYTGFGERVAYGNIPPNLYHKQHVDSNNGFEWVL